MFKKILCPTDFSEASYLALGKAVECATPGFSEICLLHVDPAGSESEGGPAVDGAVPDACTEALRLSKAIRTLCSVLEEQIPARLSARPLLMCGKPAEQILRVAREEGADLIIITTHGASGASVGTLGRVAEALLCGASCPILVVKPVRGNEDDKYCACGCEEDGCEEERRNANRNANHSVSHNVNHGVEAGSTLAPMLAAMAGGTVYRDGK